MRLGLDPTRRLETSDPVEAQILDRAVKRALELYKSDLEFLAQETANRLARALGGK